MMKKAFTMAEILLSLTIIGVIATLVLPTVTNGTAGKQFLATYKKEMSVINQSVDMNYALKGWDFSGTRDNYGTAVSDILRDRVGMTRDERTWTITGVAGSGYKFDCEKVGYATKDTVCFAANATPSIDVNTKNSNNTYSVAYTMKDGLSSLILLGASDANGTLTMPCNAPGQRVYIPAQGEDSPATYSTTAHYCLAYLDVNGPKGPNAIATCSNGVQNDGKILGDDISVGACQISSNMIHDVYPVLIFGDSVVPATAAGLAIFQDRF